MAIMATRRPYSWAVRRISVLRWPYWHFAVYDFFVSILPIFYHHPYILSILTAPSPRPGWSVE